MKIKLYDLVIIFNKQSLIDMKFNLYRENFKIQSCTLKQNI